ncbi:Nucleoside diphosphate kinase 6 [Actinomortierella ambigua]|uniref:Nucleoside diphosphate kinase n=1 Tax=Actinomortierella ambigua TaxID=1343610 RepID=A0A9P6PW49_9FUNG|nr:Nucleoside diphosphate kinase 6 [Actinomortierella ambigua]
MAQRHPLQITLALIKPDLSANGPKVLKVLKHIEENQFRILAHRRLLWSKLDAEAFYGEHRGKFFFERLCGYMTSGHFHALILEKPGAITDWRALIGPTHPPRARLNAPDTLRSLYGMTDTRNSFHGSDAIDTALKEISFFFPDFDTSGWKEESIRAHDDKA